MVVILRELRQVREDLVHHLDRQTIERHCRALGYCWRNGLLDPFNTLHLFILQVLNQNTAMTHLPHLAGERFSASAYCQARQRLPLELFKRLATLQAAQRQRVHPTGISFIDALRWLQPPKPPARLPDLLVNPPRPAAENPAASNDG